MIFAIRRKKGDTNYPNLHGCLLGWKTSLTLRRRELLCELCPDYCCSPLIPPKRRRNCCVITLMLFLQPKTNDRLKTHISPLTTNNSPLTSHISHLTTHNSQLKALDINFVNKTYNYTFTNHKINPCLKLF